MSLRKPYLIKVGRSFRTSQGQTLTAVRKDRSGRVCLRNDATGAEDWVRTGALEAMISHKTVTPLGDLRAKAKAPASEAPVLVEVEP